MQQCGHLAADPVPILGQQVVSRPGTSKRLQEASFGSEVCEVIEPCGLFPARTIIEGGGDLLQDGGDGRARRIGRRSPQRRSAELNDDISGAARQRRQGLGAPRGKRFKQPLLPPGGLFRGKQSGLLRVPIRRVGEGLGVMVQTQNQGADCLV